MAELERTQIHSKVGAGALSAALGVLTVWGLGMAGVEVPTEPAIALATVYAFVLGYVARG